MVSQMMLFDEKYKMGTTEYFEKSYIEKLVQRNADEELCKLQIVITWNI